MVWSQFNHWHFHHGRFNHGHFSSLVSIASASAIALLTLPLPAQAQPDCAAPGRGEYLLLAPTATAEAQTLVRSKAPSDATIAICRYFGETVTRIGGFNTESAASVWGQYLIRTTGIKVTIAAPIPTPVAAPIAAPASTPTTIPTTPSPTTPSPTTPSPTTPSPTTPSPTTRSTYNPKILGTGYAVLVNYNNRPEVAAQLRQAVNAKIGVVSYGERPYLLANQTEDQAAANAIMQLLSDRGFLAMVVDARRVVLLKSQIP
jgi:hypothetical protein